MRYDQSMALRSSKQIKSLVIENFRTFESLTLDNLDDVNIIVGRNNVGKTALFEALVLLGQPCHIDNSLAINEIRSLKKIAFSTIESWDTLFHDLNTDNPIRIKAVASNKMRHLLEIRIGDVVSLLKGKDEIFKEVKSRNYGALLQQKAILFDYNGPNRTSAFALAGVYASELAVLHSTEIPTPFMTPFPTTFRLLPSAPVVFSGLVRSGIEQQIQEAVKILFPDVLRLFLLVRADTPGLYVETGDGLNLPVEMLGDGATRTVSLLLALYAIKDSIILIDEVDNGIHHELLTEIFYHAVKVARSRNIQMFLTTHSYEAIQALNNARKRLEAEGIEFGMRALRLQKVEGEIKAVEYSEDVLDAAIFGQMEIR